MALDKAVNILYLAKLRISFHLLERNLMTQRSKIDMVH